MRQQVGDGDDLSVLTTPLREPAAHQIIDREAPGVDRRHRDGRRGEHLRERGEIENGIELRRRRLGFATQDAERLLPENAVVTSDIDHGCRKRGARAIHDHLPSQSEIGHRAPRRL